MTITDDMIDAAAKHLRETLQSGRKLTPWETTAKVTKRKWLTLARSTLEAALRQSSPPDGQTAGDGWQDISTAPKDGTELILLFDGGVWSGRWVQDEGWFETNNHPTDSWGFGELRPTMWRHYPGPPTKAPGEEH